MPQLPFAAHDRHSSVPVAERTPAHLVITPELLAATAPATLAFARSFHAVWFGALGALCDRSLVTLFDRFVIGPPAPLLLEVAARLRRFHEANDVGAFDDENYAAEQQWERERADHWEDEDDEDLDDFDDYPPEPPSMVQRTVESMRRCQAFQRVTMWDDIDYVLPATLKAGSERRLEMVHLSMRAEALLVVVAPLVRLNSGIVIDTRLEADRRPHRFCAA